jgi:tetratricopeptide (TPR) repeat protein
MAKRPPGGVVKPRRHRRETSATVDANPSAPSRTKLWIYVALFVATFAVYFQVRRFAFVNFDDPDYVSQNQHVRRGITGEGLVWAVTSGDAANWFPVTRLSHMLDAQFFGLRSGGHHLTSVMIHSLAAMLLFAFLNRATRARWPSAFVAILFALHPLHVESIAWVSERKDVLSALFWFLTLWLHVRYTETPSVDRYLLVVASFCFGLMAKPMIVTLPLVLVLLDVWPLRRWPAASYSKLFREKISFFVLAAAAAVVTYMVQQSSGAVRTLTAFPLGLRVENALVSYVIYIVKMFWPTGLAAFYPYPADIPLWQVVLAGMAMAAISFLALRSFRDRPYLTVGWLWYLVTLAPVIGMVQVGAQARADRYMYVPMVGLLIMLAWGAADVVQRWPQTKMALAASAAAICVIFTVLTWIQIRYWKNSESLFQHAVDVTGRNYLAQHNLGNALLDSPGRLLEAVDHLQAALGIQPDSVEAHTDLGNAWSKMPDRLPDAVSEYEEALRIAPSSPIAHNDLGNALSRMPARVPDAIEQFETALRIQPDYAAAHNNLGSALSKLGRFPEAIAQFQAALRIEPDFAGAHANLASALSVMPGRLKDAIAEYKAALKLDSDSAETHVNLGLALANMPGELPEAIAQYEAALRIRPEYPEAHNNLGSALSSLPGRLPEAIAQYEAALKIQPDFAEAHYNLGVALSKVNGRLPEAASHFAAALRIKPNYAEAHNNLGVALSQMPGRAAEAISHFEEAVLIRPDYADAHYNLGVELSQMPGRLPDAIHELETALRIEPGEEVRQTLERLRRER